MKVYHDLYWASQKTHGFDQLFNSSDFLSKFAEFKGTKYYEKWKQTKEYQRYLKWQSS